MPKNTTTQRLIKSPEEWENTKTVIREHVERIAARYDDQEQAESLVLLIDLLTNSAYDRLDREGIATIAKNHAFSFTAAFETAMDICLQKVSADTELSMVH